MKSEAGLTLKKIISIKKKKKTLEGGSQTVAECFVDI